MPEEMIDELVDVGLFCQFGSLFSIDGKHIPFDKVRPLLTRLKTISDKRWPPAALCL